MHPPHPTCKNEGGIRPFPSRSFTASRRQATHIEGAMAPPHTHMQGHHAYCAACPVLPNPTVGSTHQSDSCMCMVSLTSMQVGGCLVHVACRGAASIGLQNGGEGERDRPASDLVGRAAAFPLSCTHAPWRGDGPGCPGFVAVPPLPMCPSHAQRDVRAAHKTLGVVQGAVRTARVPNHVPQ